jgi:hypothetical protein
LIYFIIFLYHIHQFLCKFIRQGLTTVWRRRMCHKTWQKLWLRLACVTVLRQVSIRSDLTRRREGSIYCYSLFGIFSYRFPRKQVLSFYRMPSCKWPSPLLKLKYAGWQVNLLKPTGHMMHPQFNIQQFYFLPHTVLMCFVSIWEQTATSVPYNTNWLIFITEMKSVYCAVRNGSLHKAVCASYLKVKITDAWLRKVLQCFKPFSYFMSLANVR